MGSDYYTGEPLCLREGGQLLLDDTLVEDRWRLRRVIHCPEKHPRNPVVTVDKPWEGDYITYPMVIWDDAMNKFRMWYTTAAWGDYERTAGVRHCLAYAESDDGINWEKPQLDLCPINGAKTNVLYTGTFSDDPAKYGAVVTQIFRDDADQDPARRYKMISYEARLVDGVYRRGINLGVSPDGLEWSLGQERHILDYNSDTANHVVFDPGEKRWLLYCRPRCVHATGLQPQDPMPGYPGGRHSSRRVAVMTSTDFERWSYPRICLYPDESDTPDYDSSCVFRNGSHFIMLYSAFEGDDEGCKEIKLASSSDGFVWQRTDPRAAFIARGRPGDWDAGELRPATQPIRRMSNLYTYYWGAPRGQYDWVGIAGVGLTMSRADRFVEQRADDATGFLITREFMLEGNRLYVNTTHGRTGDRVRELRVEVAHHPDIGNHGGFDSAYEGFSFEDCDPQSTRRRPIGGESKIDTIQRNTVDTPVTWRGSPDLSSLRGKPVYLRFRLQNMGIFSFRVTDE